MTEAPTAGARRLALLLLIVVSVFNYLDRTIISILQVPIKRDLSLSDAQLGALTGLAFALFYSTLGVPIARFADRYSRRWVIAGSIALWSAMTAISGFSTSFAALVFFRIGVALGEAGSIPATHSMLADYYPPERRATALAIWGLALPIGVMLGYLSGGWLAQAIDWRAALWIVGGVGVLLAPLILALLREPERGRRSFRRAGVQAGHQRHERLVDLCDGERAGTDGLGPQPAQRSHHPADIRQPGTARLDLGLPEPAAHLRRGGALPVLSRSANARPAAPSLGGEAVHHGGPGGPEKGRERHGLSRPSFDPPQIRCRKGLVNSVFLCEPASRCQLCNDI